MANIGQKYIEHIDDPMSTIVSETEGTTITWATSKDAGTAPVRAVAAGKGVHYAGATVGTAADHIEFCTNNLIFAGQEGHCEVECLLQLSSWSYVAVNFGFNDDVLDTSTTLPIEVSSAAITANAATFVGLVYDTDMTYDEFHCIWVDDSSVGFTDADSSVDGKSVRLKGCVPTASKWIHLKVQLDDRGSGYGLRATFTVTDHLGRTFARTFNTSVDRDCPLCFYLGVEDRASASANSIYIRCPNWKQSIPDM